MDEQTAHETDMAGPRLAAARRMVKRLVAHLAAGGTTDFADEPMAVDPAIYTDAARAEAEMQRVWLRAPLLVGLSCELSAPGERLLFEELGHSVLVVRGDDGVARGFRNLCRHRGARLVGAGGAACTASDLLRCPFHGWTYALDGRLLGQPGRSGFEALLMPELGLLPVPVSERHGMLFVHLDGAAAIDVTGFLGPFNGALALLQLGELRLHRRSALTAACNWKLALDTYAESYHFGVLHAESIGRSHHANVAAFDDFGLHWRMGFASRALDALVGAPLHCWPDGELEAVHYLFPNTVLVAGALRGGGRYLRVFRLFPHPGIGAVRCRLAAYAAPPELPNPFLVDDLDSEVTWEDYRVAEGIQANLETAVPGFRPVFGRNEIGVQAVHRALARVLERGL